MGAVFLLALFLFSLTGEVAARSAEGKHGGEGEWAKTAAAADKERKLVVFLYQRGNIEAAVKAFEKKYPDIGVSVASVPAAETGPRIMAERRAGKFLWMDVALSRDDRQAMDWLAVGKFPLCLFCGDIETARAQALPVEEFNTTKWKESPAIYSGSNGTVTLMNNAPHPNAARLFINWLLSREGQASFQKIMNTPDLVMESMRVDIPKEPIAPEKRRAAGVNYIVMDTPERSDQAPVGKLLREIIKK
jgi:ABC-type glycerol-3-phosphate transport system substrate-binding protein